MFSAAPAGYVSTQVQTLFLLKFYPPALPVRHVYYVGHTHCPRLSTIVAPLTLPVLSTSSLHQNHIISKIISKIRSKIRSNSKPNRHPSSRGCLLEACAHSTFNNLNSSIGFDLSPNTNEGGATGRSVDTSSSAPPETYDQVAFFLWSNTAVFSEFRGTHVPV